MLDRIPFSLCPRVLLQFGQRTISLYRLILLWQRMAVNLCAAHKKTNLRVAHEVLLVCFLQLCMTRSSYGS